MMDIFEIIKQELALVLDLEEEDITRDSLLWEDLNIDSIKRLEFLFILRKKYNIEVIQEEMLNIRSVGDLEKYLKVKSKSLD